MYSGEALMASRVSLTWTFSSLQLTRSIYSGGISTFFPDHQFQVSTTSWTCGSIVRDDDLHPATQSSRSFGSYPMVEASLDSAHHEPISMICSPSRSASA